MTYCADNERTINLLYATDLEIAVYMAHTIINQNAEGKTDYKTDPLFIKYKHFVSTYEELLAKGNERIRKRTIKISDGN